MTSRDRTLLLGLLVLGIAAAVWFAMIAPKRSESADLDGKVEAAQTRLTNAQAAEAAGIAAQTSYQKDYATVARLGKAVPADDDVPSLVVQMQGIADRSRTDFRTIEVGEGADGAAPTAPVAANTAAVNSAAGTTGATGVAAPAVPTQAATAGLPPGAVVGSAGFPTMPFDLTFTGSFFRLKDLLHEINDLTVVRGNKITVRGRLMAVDAFVMRAAANGFPFMQTSLSTTTYIVPAGQGATAGATAATPAATTVPTGATP